MFRTCSQGCFCSASLLLLLGSVVHAGPSQDASVSKAIARAEEALKQVQLQYLKRMPQVLKDGRRIEMSTGADVNAKAQVVGTCWVKVKEGDFEEAFFWDSVTDDIVILPIPKAPQGLPPYTSVTVCAVSDDGLVACTARRPRTPPGGVFRPTMRVHVFNVKTKTFEELPLPPGRNSSTASRVTPDGTMVIGKAMGGGVLCSCVWRKRAQGGWTVEELPGGDGCYAFGISPNGCCIVGKSPKGQVYVPTMWSAGKMGGWTQVHLSNDPGIATAVDNAGTVAGYAPAADGEFHAFVCSKGKLRDLGVLPGHGSSRAWGISHGKVVGWSQEKRMAKGTAGRQRAFIWDTKDGMRRLFVQDTTDALAISPQGLITGAYAEHRVDPEDERDRAYVYSFYRVDTK